MEQVWFAGVHSNVGGGYPDAGLSNHALLWMLERAQSAGLAIEPEVVAKLEAKCDGVLYDSMSRFYRAMGEHRRELFVERRATDGRPIHTFESVHESVLQRHRATKPPYAPDNLRSWLTRFAERMSEGAVPQLDAGIPVFPIKVADSSVPEANTPDAAPELQDVTSGASARPADQSSAQGTRPPV